MSALDVAYWVADWPPFQWALLALVGALFLAAAARYVYLGVDFVRLQTHLWRGRRIMMLEVSRWFVDVRDALPPADVFVAALRDGEILEAQCLDWRKQGLGRPWRNRQGAIIGVITHWQSLGGSIRIVLGEGQ